MPASHPASHPAAGSRTPPAPPAPIAPGITLIDLEYLGEQRSVAAVVLAGQGAVALLDPGPTTTLDTLRRRLAELGASISDIESVLLTHIHLDHAGCTGTLVRENPRIRVYVHARGAAHVIDPARLLRSATMIYGDRMAELWGDVAPVPAANVSVLEAENALHIAGRPVRAAYTPGHAWHHVAYLDETSGVAFVGDTLGERYPGQSYVLPVTPPPDVDLERWSESLRRIRAWDPSQVVVTHFGAYPDAARHIDDLAAHLDSWAELVRASLADGGGAAGGTAAGQAPSDDARAAAFAARITAELRQILPADVVARYAHSIPSSWVGLARYWRTRSAGVVPDARA